MTIRLLIATAVLARRVMTTIPEIADQRTTTISRRSSSVAHAQRMTRPRRFRRRLRHHPHRRRRPIRPVRMTIRLLIATVVLARRVMTIILEIADQRTTTISRRASSAAHAQRMTRPRRFRRRLRHHPYRLRRPIRPVRMTIRRLIATVVLARRVMTVILEIADQRTTTISRRATSVARAQRMTTTA